METARLSAVIEGDTRPLQKSVDHANSLLGNVGSGIGNVAGLAFGGLVAGIAGVGAGLAVAGKSAANFQSQISGISAVGGSEAVDRMSEISAKALQVGKDTSFSASEAASGMQELIKAGVSISAVLGPATDATVALAAATGVNLAGAAEIASNAMNQFGLEGAEIASVADIVAGAANASAIDVNDFKFSLASAGAVANTIGFTFKDTAVAIAALGQAGIKGSDAGTSLKTMFLNLQPVTDKQVALFRQLGLANDETSSTFFDMQGKIKPMREVFGLLNASLKDYTEQERLAALETIFGSDAIRAGAIATKLGAEGFDEMAAAMDKVSAADVAKTRLDNLNGGIEALKGSLETAGIIIGTAFLPALRKIVTGATDVLNANMPMIEQFAKSLPLAIEQFATMIQSKFAIASLAVEYFGKMMFNQGQYLEAFRSLITALLGTNALDGLVTFLGTRLPPVIQWLTGTGWPGMVAAATTVSTWWTSTGQPAFTALADFLGTTIPPILTWISETGWPGLVAAGETVQAKVLEMNTALGALFVEMDKRGVFTDLNAIWTDLNGIAATLVEMITALAPPVRDADEASARMNATTGVTAGIFKDASGGVREFVAQVREIVDAANAAGKWLDDLQAKINGAGLGINKFMRENNFLLGQGFVTSVAEGITSGTPALEAAASNAADSVPSIFQDSWDMRSPSKVAMTQGFQYATGLANGIAQGNNAVHEAVLAIVKNALLNNIDPMIALALAKAESGFDPRAANQAGEDSHGLFQMNRAGGQGAGFSVAQLQDPWVNASKFLGAHGELFAQLKATGLAGEELAATFGRIAEGSDPDFAHRYATAYRELVAQFGATGAAALALTGTTQQLGAAQQQSNVWAETMAAQQAAFNQVITQQAPAMRPSIDAMIAFGQVLGPIERQVAGGSIQMETLHFKLVDLARATGLATKPWADYSAGLIDIDEAMMRVVLQSADAGPQFEALRQQLGTTNTITDEGTLKWLQLALAMGKVAPATAAATLATTAATTATTAVTAATGVATTATAGLGTTTDAAMNKIDPELMLQAADASRQMAEALGTADAAYGKVRESASQASSVIQEFLGAAQSLGDYLDNHTFEFHVNIPDIPDWATPGSPMPLETAFRGLNSALKETARTAQPSLRDLAMPALTMSGRSGSADSQRGGDTITINVMQQPGENGQAFARRVVAVLDEQRSTARRRG